MKLLIATNNKNKVIEIKSKLEEYNIEIITPSDLNINNFEIEETENTLEGNALLKAKAFFDKSGITTFSDDTGLFVEALDGRPGVYSARYAGENASNLDNCQKLLNELEDKENRNAEFRTIFCYYDGSSVVYLEGRCKGKIISEMRGDNGFGYDPIFIPDGFELTFAELDSEVKNNISHRAKATEEFVKFIRNKI